MQTSRCGADAFYLTNMKATEHKNVGVGCVWLESRLLDLEAALKPLLQQTGSSAPLNSTCPETCTNAYFTCTLSYTHRCTCKCGTEHVGISLSTYWFTFVSVIMFLLSVLLCHSLGSQYQHRNWNCCASHWGHAVTLCDSCLKHLEGFSQSTLRAPQWTTMVSLLQIYRFFCGLREKKHTQMLKRRERERIKMFENGVALERT